MMTARSIQIRYFKGRVISFIISILVSVQFSYNGILRRLSSSSEKTYNEVWERLILDDHGHNTNTTALPLRFDEAAAAFMKQAQRIRQITTLLESYDIDNNSPKYYIYDSRNLTLPWIRRKAFRPRAKPVWGKQQWTKRFIPYFQGELKFHYALENHRLRTYNISNAAFIIIPIPIGAALFWGTKSDYDVAFRHLFENELYFQQYPEKHVLISNNERLFRLDIESIKAFEKDAGFTQERISKLQNVTLVKDVDHHFVKYFELTHISDFDDENTPFHHVWSIGYSHDASNTEYIFEIPDFNSWKNKTYHFFYHTTNSTSMNNSTQYRHAPVNNPTMISQFIEPSSIGYDIPYNQWIQEYSDSKFCLIIRGDNPSSRSLYRAIRQGCIPVIVSDSLPYYQPIYRSLIRYTDFAIMVKEKGFLHNPVKALNDATTNLSDEQIILKLDGLAFVQRMMVLDHPDPLFVPAFVHETIASQQDSYYDFAKWTI